MRVVSFCAVSEVNARDFKYVVIAARYNAQWIFCRHRQRSTWEMPGGHIEAGEDSLTAAKRELFEETGAEKFDIRPVCAYKVDDYGVLYYAEIQTLGALPKYEIGEIILNDSLPSPLTYPDIHTSLYMRVQGWLNVQSNADEIWDVYDRNRILTGRTHRRGDPLRDGDFHLVVDVWLQNGNGEFLLTKRALNKGFSNMWECTGGSALAGENSLTAAVREVQEEAGLRVSSNFGECVMSIFREGSIKDIWLFRQSFPLDQIVLQPGETCDAKYASEKEIIQMRDTGTLVPLAYLDEFFSKIRR